MQDKENMEQFFDDSWVHMHGLLDEHFPAKEKKKRRLAIWWWLGATTVLLSFGIMLWFNNQTIEKSLAPRSTAKTELIKPEKTSKTQSNPITEKVLETQNVNIEQEKGNTKDRQPNKSKLEQDVIKGSSVIISNPLSNIKNSISGTQDLTIYPNSVYSRVEAPVLQKTNRAIVPVQKEEKRSQVTLIPPLPKLAPSALFAEAEDVKIHQHKTKKKLYYELYTGASQSNLGYISGFIGFDIGRSLTKRLSMEIGLGYRTILSGKTFVDSTAKALDFYAKAEDYTIVSIGSGFGLDLVGNKESLRLHLVELPLKIRYQITPRWSIYGEAIGVYQLAKNVPDAFVFQVNSAPSVNKEYLPVAKLSAHSYIGLGGGVSFGKNHWRLNAGYNNWALFKPDNQYYVGVKYRF